MNNPLNKQLARDIHTARWLGMLPRQSYAISEYRYPQTKNHFRIQDTAKHVEQGDKLDKIELSFTVGLHE